MGAGAGAGAVLCTVPPMAPPTTAPITNRPTRAMMTLSLVVRRKDFVLEQCASEALSGRFGLNPPYTHNRRVEKIREMKSHLPLGISIS